MGAVSIVASASIIVLVYMRLPSLGAILNSDQVLLQAIVDQALMVGRDWTKDTAMHFTSSGDHLQIPSRVLNSALSIPYGHVRHVQGHQNSHRSDSKARRRSSRVTLEDYSLSMT